MRVCFIHHFYADTMDRAMGNAESVRRIRGLRSEGVQVNKPHARISDKGQARGIHRIPCPAAHLAAKGRMQLLVQRASECQPRQQMTIMLITCALC